jgi:pimeloyl-ACP methyl ester carboxylesterase
VVRSVAGVSATQAALLADMEKVNLVASLPRLDVPVVMVQGRLDQVAPPAAAQRYADALQAPSKRLVWFERSAHTPHLEEPDKFRDLLSGVRTNQLTTIKTMDQRS